MYNIEDLGSKWSPAIRLKIVVQTDRQNLFLNVLSKTFRMIYDTSTKAEKLVGDEENIIPPPLH